MEALLMSKKERDRKALMEMVRQKKLSLKQAAVQCELSYRQTLRVYQKYEALGDAGLIHKSRGRQSNRRHPHQAKIIARYSSRYEVFGPTLASEYLAEDGFQIDHETLRRLLLKHGLWQRHRKRSPYRQRRERKAQFGELLQIDGSIHDWLGTGKHSCLLNLIDDATGKTWSQLAEGETTRIVFQVLWHWISTYGIPLAIYVDLKNVYVSPKAGSLSHFEVACKKLGIRVIKARSPQAKGRVERNHAVYQDRLVKDLALKGVKTIADANAVLNKGFIANLNRKFEKPPSNPHSAHLVVKDLDLNQILCWEYSRKLQHDWTFSFKSKCYQVQKKRGACIKPSSKITIRTHLDGTISLWHRGKKLSFQAIAHKPAQEKEAALKTRKTKRCSSAWAQTNTFLFQNVANARAALTKNVLRKRPL
jgi:transposase